MKNISFFARPYFLGLNESVAKDAVMFRASSYIRGEQVANFIGGKYNPTEGFENDVCIYIKPLLVSRVRDGSYIDVIDGDYLIEQLKSRPKIKVIASLESGYRFLKEKLDNEIVLIPQHHCNFERIKRKRKKIITGGYISSPSSIAYLVNGKIKKELSKIGLKFITCYNYKNRLDVVNFYKKIDFQIIGFFGYFGNHNPFTHPLKIVNAASFGIPTVAQWKMGYEEFKGNYIPVDNMDSLMIEVEKLKDKKYYSLWSDKIRKEAERYHIENIAKLYKKLK